MSDFNQEFDELQAKVSFYLDRAYLLENSKGAFKEALNVAIRAIENFKNINSQGDKNERD